jgi:hypothetical protein
MVGRKNINSITKNLCYKKSGAAYWRVLLELEVGPLVDLVVGALVDFVVGALVDFVVGALVDFKVGALVDLEEELRTRRELEVGPLVDLVVGALVDFVVGALVDFVVGALVDFKVGALVDLEEELRTRPCSRARVLELTASRRTAINWTDFMFCSVVVDRLQTVCAWELWEACALKVLEMGFGWVLLFVSCKTTLRDSLRAHLMRLLPK